MEEVLCGGKEAADGPKRAYQNRHLDDLPLQFGCGPFVVAQP